MSRPTPFRTVLVCASAIFAALGASCSKEASSVSPPEGPPVVAVASVKKMDLSRTLTLTGEFIPFQEVEVMSKVAGFVKQIGVDVGDRVRTGQVLATLEVPEMADDLVKAAATVQRGNAEIERARGDMSRSKAAVEIAHLSYQRLLDVSKTRPGLVAQQELDDARSKDVSAEAQLAASQSNLVAAEQQAQVSKADEARYKTLYAYTRVTAPFDGVITKRYANTGSMVQAGTASQTQAMPVVRISQNSLLRLLLPVPESAVSSVRLHQKVDVKVPSLKRSFEGSVARFTDRLSTATRTMETEVDVPNAQLVLIPGMYAEVSLRLEEATNALAAPLTAVDISGSIPKVYRVGSGGTVEVVTVQLGMETASEAEILSGLSDGDLVVIGDRSSIKAGDKVTPKIGSR